MTYLLADSGERLTLRRPAGPDSLETAGRVAVTLWPVVRPLAVDLWLACARPETGELWPEGEPPTPRRHIRQEPAPIPIESWAGSEPQITRVPRLTPAGLVAWLQEAGRQTADCHPALERLRVDYAAARLPTDQMPPDGEFIPVRDGSTYQQVPVWVDGEEVWVAGPQPGRLLFPPIFYALAHEWGWLQLDIWVTWGDLWTRPGSALEAALQELVDQGWEAERVPPGFRLSSD
ncbi:MAG: hypothetical protein KatS3mg050_1015 [Litorilinea sp.]|nr:MAG: hypothetical protein KatS3mg050_1015 [Litorilinea sp.]